MPVLTFVRDSLLGKTEKQVDSQAHRVNPGIRAYNRRAPPAQSFYLLEGGATSVGRTERAGGMVIRAGVPPPPSSQPPQDKKEEVWPHFIVANASPG